MGQQLAGYPLEIRGIAEIVIDPHQQIARVEIGRVVLDVAFERLNRVVIAIFLTEPDRIEIERLRILRRQLERAGEVVFGLFVVIQRAVGDAEINFEDVIVGTVFFRA